jgi:hypothetical protein
MTPKPKPTMADLKSPEPDPCPLCGRPNHHPSDHHLVPRSRGGKVTTHCCRDCHDAMHSLFSNKELERDYSSVEALMAHEGFARMVAHIAKQNPLGRVRFKVAKNQRRRGRNG